MTSHTPNPIRILIVDDEELLAEALSYQLEYEGYACTMAHSLKDARAQLHKLEFELVLLDVRLPDGNGLDMLAEIKSKIDPDLPVVILTSFAKVEDAVQAVKLGAADYLVKPDNPQHALIVLERVLSDSDRRRQLDLARQRDQQVIGDVQMIGSSVCMRQLHQDIARISALDAPDSATRPTVLIQGETGTGKNLVAKTLHISGAHAARPFVHVDCSSLPENLIESELFGHEKGAFTQANQSRTGLIEAAEDGTIFLDEIGELPLSLQAKLLAVLDRRKIRRVGSDRERPVRASFVAATNRNMEEMVGSGQFRPDLYYRLNVLTLDLPPLRQREDDILLLARRFASLVARKFGLQEIFMDEVAQKAMLQYPWPGNVRELKHVMERAVLLHSGGNFPLHLLQMSGADLKNVQAALPSAAALIGPDSLDLVENERRLIQAALDQEQGNISRAARLLGLSRGALRGRLSKHDFSVED
jgi:two-component system, NtrC family, response regulator AtoC